MEFIYEILNNLALFFSRELVYHIALPIIIIIIAINAIGLLFTSKSDKKEALISSIQAKVIGLVILVLLPVILSVFLGFMEKITGITPNVDTSILNEMQSSTVVSTEEANIP